MNFALKQLTRYQSVAVLSTRVEVHFFKVVKMSVDLHTTRRHRRVKPLMTRLNITHRHIIITANLVYHSEFIQDPANFSALFKNKTILLMYFRV